MISLLVEYLAIFYQAGDAEQLAAIARSLLAAIPGDVVALQFLGMALYQMGRVGDAYRTFEEVAIKLDQGVFENSISTCELASAISFREATIPHPGFAAGWLQIAQVLKRFGFQRLADRAQESAAAARGTSHQTS